MSQSDEFQARLRTLEELRAAGIDPYPPRAHPTHTAAQVRALLQEREGDHVTVAGRIVGGLRPMGKLAFVHLQDGSMPQAAEASASERRLNGRIQLSIQRPVVGEEGWALFRRLHAGDFVEAAGTTFHTQRGEPSVRVERLTLLAKALRPLPEKFHGLEDTEARYRQRYLDLLVNEDTRRVFLLRSRLVGYMRRFLEARGFIEVETPILQPLYGGGAARPFITHFNVLDEDLYLRIALELYLKRLIIGGFDRVYEIGHNFRNEGFSRQHSPEYTMLEAYQAYADYTDMMELCETMIEGAARELLGTTRLTVAGREVDLAAPWPRVPLLDAIAEYSGVDVRAHPSQDELYAAAARAGVELPSATPRAKIVDELLKTFVEPRLIAPTHLIDYPVELSPLAKRKPGTDGLVERFESFIGGIEIANAFTELNDPIDQRARFLQQQDDRAHGDEEAHPSDEDFLLALEHGMPPAGGIGIGVDRVTMVFTGATNIRDVILFPHLRRDER
jgi:lysyl-tRNA synthetase class 2